MTTGIYANIHVCPRAEIGNNSEANYEYWESVADVRKFNFCVLFPLKHIVFEWSLKKDVTWMNRLIIIEVINWVPWPLEFMQIFMFAQGLWLETMAKQMMSVENGSLTWENQVHSPACSKPCLFFYISGAGFIFTSKKSFFLLLILPKSYVWLKEREKHKLF